MICDGGWKSFVTEDARCRGQHVGAEQFRVAISDYVSPGCGRVCLFAWNFLMLFEEISCTTSDLKLCYSKRKDLRDQSATLPVRILKLAVS